MYSLNIDCYSNMGEIALKFVNVMHTSIGTFILSVIPREPQRVMLGVVQRIPPKKIVNQQDLSHWTEFFTVNKQRCCKH